MKIAEVTYTGPMRTHYYTCRSGSEYTFKNGRAEAIDSVEDAKHLETQNGFDVEWTLHGRLLRETDGSRESVRECITEFGYTKKQKYAKMFGIKANQKEEELEEELLAEVESLQNVAESN